MPVIIKTALDSIVLMTSQSLQIMIRCKYDATSGWRGGGTRGRGEGTWGTCARASILKTTQIIYLAFAKKLPIHILDFTEK